MTAPACTVLIGTPDLLVALRRTAPPDDEVLAFADADALRAFEAIASRRPSRITLDHVFAATPRGAALISRVKTDPALTHAEIHVVSEDGTSRPAAVVAATGPVAALDQIGTRRAPRYRIASVIDVLVDGHPARLIDLSTCGAQILRDQVLKPGQRVRVTLPDQEGVVRLAGAVAWALFEIPPGQSARYRAGIEFHGADEEAVDAFRQRHTGAEMQ